MAYITYAEYTALYGDTVSEDIFPIYAENASDLVDLVTRYQIEQCGGLSALPPLVQNLVKKATAAQVLYFSENGLNATMAGQLGQGFTVGKVSISGGNASGASGRGAAQSMISPAATAMLEQTGLMGRSVPCLDLYLDACLRTP